jgi:hypothetical protein
MDAFTTWVECLETRHLESLRFSEVSRALRALSSIYVERRSRLVESPVFSGAGKRAAFALFYGPLHFLVVQAVVRGLPRATDPVPVLIDLGCGTGAAGAAWASACAAPPRVLGIDRNEWAIQEAARTYRAFGLSARTVRSDLVPAVIGSSGRQSVWPRGPAAVLAAFVLNELSHEHRTQILERLLERAAAGDRVLVVEPIATAVTPWWPEWQARVHARGGRADQWRVRVDLPPIVQKLDRAAGKDHRELTARSLYLSGDRSPEIRVQSPEVHER